MKNGFWVDNKILRTTPERIVSLVPSQTELLFDLRLEEKVLGITKFCVHPQNWLKEKTIVGGTKNANIEKIKSLQPDLIIGNKEENLKEELERLSTFAPVWVSDIETLEDSFQMIAQIGHFTNSVESANEIIEKINNGFPQLTDSTKSNKTVAYLIWRKPWMAAASHTFINNLLNKIGFVNVFENETRYPEFSLEGLNKLNPDYIFLSSEPYPFKGKHADEIREILPHSKIVFVDGEFFSWYGSRLIRASDYFKKLMTDNT